MKKKIRPHKGDVSGSRSEWLPGGMITPAQKKKLGEIMDDFTGSFADWVLRAMEQDSRSLVYYSYQLPNGQWQAIASTDSTIEAVENCEFHAQGRPWVIADSSATVFELLNGA